MWRLNQARPTNLGFRSRWMTLCSCTWLSADRSWRKIFTASWRTTVCTPQRATRRTSSTGHTLVGNVALHRPRAEATDHSPSACPANLGASHRSTAPSARTEPARIGREPTNGGQHCQTLLAQPLQWLTIRFSKAQRQHQGPLTSQPHCPATQRQTRTGRLRRRHSRPHRRQTRHQATPAGAAAD